MCANKVLPFDRDIQVIERGKKQEDHYAGYSIRNERLLGYLLLLAGTHNFCSCEKFRFI